jgi:hypothetical protein
MRREGNRDGHSRCGVSLLEISLSGSRGRCIAAACMASPQVILTALSNGRSRCSYPVWSALIALVYTARGRFDNNQAVPRWCSRVPDGGARGGPIREERYIVANSRRGNARGASFNCLSTDYGSLDVGW